MPHGLEDFVHTKFLCSCTDWFVSGLAEDSKTSCFFFLDGTYILPSCSISIDVHLRKDNLSNLLFVLYHVLVERE